MRQRLLWVTMTDIEASELHVCSPELLRRRVGPRAVAAIQEQFPIRTAHAISGWAPGPIAANAEADSHYEESVYNGR